jgi:prepilin-type N-terminal cleavage/methylation domain-containing protein
MFINRRRGMGFTLLELVIAMAVFSIVAVALFRVLDACMRTAGELQDSQRITRQMAVFTELCRKTFGTLPSSATFRVPLMPEAEGQEIVFGNAPAIFALGDAPLNYGTTTLAVRPREDGLFELALSRSDFGPPKEEDGLGGEVPLPEPDEKGRYWLLLVGELEWARWRFYDPRAKEWVESWTRSNRPPLVELSLLLTGDTVPYRAVFPVSFAQNTGGGPAEVRPNRRGRRR